MKESKFNVFQEIKNKKILAYNTLTTALVVLEPCVYKSIFENRNYLHKDAIELLKQGFLIDDEFDEYKYLKSLREIVAKSNNKISNLIVATTMDCNARCYYCFEHGCHHDTMTLETADALVDYICKNWNGKQLCITWFGGEPLLAPHIIDYITECLEKQNINFISKITTNGFLLNENICKKAKYVWHTTRIQVSMDGMGEDYNRIKCYVNTDDSVNPFEVVIQNLETALKTGLLVHVRINSDPNNMQKMIEFMDYLQEKFGSFDNFRAYFAPIDADSKTVAPIADKFEDKKTHPYLQMIEISEKYEKNIVNQNEYLNNLRLYPSPTNCYSSCAHIFAIDSRGDLYKCHRMLGKGKKYCSGNIKTGVIENNIYQYFCNTDFSLPECENCKLLPVCQGGCKINAYTYHDAHACVPTKAVLNELILYYARNMGVDC